MAEGRKEVCCAAAQLCVNGKPSWRLPALHFPPLCIAQGMVLGMEGTKEEECRRKENYILPQLNSALESPLSIPPVFPSLSHCTPQGKDAEIGKRWRVQALPA